MDVSSFSLLFSLLIVIILIFTYYNKEAFENPTFHMPESPVVQKNLVEASEEEYAPMSVDTVGPAPGTVASFNSLPYKDPSLEKANYQRILNVQTTLKGFLQNEAINIQDLSDPSIQLPLSSARADLERLNNEVMVLKRNPGIESTLTQYDIDEIQSNLAYLQRKWRMSVYNDLDSVEAFQDASGSDVTNINLSNAGLLGSLLTTMFSGSNATNTSNTSNVTPSSNNVSMSDLRTLITKIDVTIARLTSSGTTDPIVLARVSVLNKIKERVNAILNDVVAGVRNEKDIPITKDAMNEFLKTIANTDSPVSQLFGSNVALADLFPAYSAGDTTGAMFSQYLFKQYADTLFKGLSWNVGVDLKYTSENERDMVNSFASAIQSSIPNANISTQPYNTPTLQNLMPYTNNNNNNSFSNVVNNLQQQYLTNDSNYIATGQQQQQQQQQQQTSKGQPFDWHQRANFICDSVQKRGLNPSDFGCLRPEDYVSENFSWRGYAKMICGRLATSYDTGLPEVCGCPPDSWAGWKS